LSGVHHDAVASLAKYLGEGTEPWGSRVGAAPFFIPESIKKKAGALPDHCSLIVFAIGRGSTGLSSAGIS